MSCSDMILPHIKDCNEVFTKPISYFINTKNNKVYLDKELTQFVGQGEYNEETGALYITQSDVML